MLTVCRRTTSTKRIVSDGVRRGTHDKPAGCAVVLSNAEPGQIKMAGWRDARW